MARRKATPPTTPSLTMNAEQFRDFLLHRESLVANATTRGQDFLRTIMDPRRDVDESCGYPSLRSAIPIEMYTELYERDAIAARVVEVLPRESWQVQPTVYEEEDSDTITEFEESWDALGSGLRGEESWYEEEESSPVWEYLLRVDELSGIGRYGVLLMGLDDVKGNNPDALRQPVKSAKRLLFLRAFPESLAQITQWEQDFSSPRYGMPVEYQLTMSNPLAMTRDFTYR